MSQEKPKRHPTPPRSDAPPPPPPAAPSRSRLTEAELEDTLTRFQQSTPRLAALDKPLRTRTGRHQSWWQRGWKR